MVFLWVGGGGIGRSHPSPYPRINPWKKGLIIIIVNFQIFINNKHMKNYRK